MFKIIKNIEGKNVILGTLFLCACVVVSIALFWGGLFNDNLVKNSGEKIIRKYQYANLDRYKYSDYKYDANSEYLFPIIKNGKQGFINHEGVIVVPPLYFPSHRYIEKTQQDVSHDAIPVVIKSAKYSNGVEIPGVYNFLNSKGKIAYENSFENAGTFSEGLCPVESKGKWGFIDINGDFVLNPEYDIAREFHEGLAVVRKGKTIYYINKKGEEVIVIKTPTNFLGSSFNEGIAKIQDRDKMPSHFYYINNKGEKIINFDRMTYASDFENGRAKVLIQDKNTKIPANPLAPFYQRYGIIDSKGEFVIPPIYFEMGYYSEGMVYVASHGKNKNYKIQKKYTYLDMDGKKVFSVYAQDAGDFSQGLAKIKIENKYGFINAKGEVVVKPLYEDVKSYSEGYACVKLAGKWGFIDTKGVMVIKNDFEECFDFICGLARFWDGYGYGYVNMKGEIIWNPTK